MGKKSEVVTSLRIDSVLWKEAKIKAIKQGTTLSSLVNNAIRNDLRKKNDSSTSKNDQTIHKP